MNSFSEFSKQPVAVNAGSGFRIDNKAEKLIDLNQVFQTSLEVYVESIKKSGAIIRCDNLPLVYGDSVQMLKLFNLLLKMILLNHVNISKSFIYIKCEFEKEDDVLDLSIRNGFKKFTISVYSNTQPLSEWISNFQQELTELKNICIRLNGSFYQHTSSETGCLFTLKLTGKNN